MKRLARHLFTLCAATSLLLFMAVCVLWVSGYFAVDRVMSRVQDRPPSGPFSERTWQLISARGQFAVVMAVTTGADSGSAGLTWTREPSQPILPPGGGPDGNILDWLGFHFVHEFFSYGFGSGTQLIGIVIPPWSAAVACAVAPTLWVIIWKRRRRLGMRLAVGLCPRCGYDLRGTPHRCPECGTVAVPA